MKRAGSLFLEDPILKLNPDPVFLELGLYIEILILRSYNNFSKKSSKSVCKYKGIGIWEFNSNKLMV